MALSVDKEKDVLQAAIFCVSLWNNRLLSACHGIVYLYQSAAKSEGHEVLSL